MQKTKDLRERLSGGEFDEKLAYIYACTGDVKPYAERYVSVIDGYAENFGETEEIALFSAPGRTEIGGNHTDHQHGCVLAGSVNLDVIAAVAFNNENVIRIKSKGYPMDEIAIDDLEVHPEQFEKAASLIRGVMKRFSDMGYELKGFNAYTESNVLKGSGLSSSAAFEVLVGTIINHLCANAGVDAVEIAKIGKYAENVYYNKPSGLMDQMASSVGSVVAIDFASTEEPIVEKVDFDLSKFNHSLCIIDSGADHADLTDEYASVPQEMKLVAEYFGKPYLREVKLDEFLAEIKNIRKKVNNDRAVLRAFHFLHENECAVEQANALRNDNFDEFCKLNRKSGQSSFMYLQNVYAASMPKQQAVALTIAMCGEILGERGSYRVHGGGFAGTVQAFVPNDMLDEFKIRMESMLGDGMCHVLSIRPVGGYRLA